MRPQAQVDYFHQVLERASVEILGEMLASAKDPEKLLAAILRQAMHLVQAPLGLVFGPGDLLLPVGYSPEESQLLRQQLAPVLTGEGLRFYSGPRFTGQALSSAELAAASSAGEGNVVGMAGALVSPAETLAVVAVEREQPFSAAERQQLGEWLRLATAPAQAAAETARAHRLHEGGQLALTDLPLNRLENVPTLEQIERLVIAEALRRNHNNKTRAAAVLGITREGLRKKLLRLGM